MFNVPNQKEYKFLRGRFSKEISHQVFVEFKIAVTSHTTAEKQPHDYSSSKISNLPLSNATLVNVVNTVENPHWLALEPLPPPPPIIAGRRISAL